MGVTAEQMGELRRERGEIAEAVAELTASILALIEYLKGQEARDANRRLLQATR